MMRRRNPPPRRGAAGPRRAPDKEKEIDSELRAARANRKATSVQKQQLRRLDWDSELDDDTDEDSMFGAEESAAEEDGDETPEER